MSTTSKAGATSAASVASAPSRVVTGNRASLFDRVDGLGGSAGIGFNGHWRPYYDERNDQGAFEGDGSDYGDEPQLFTPLMARLAASFPASPAAGDSAASPIVFLTDLARAVGIYEGNMRLFAGAFTRQGSLVNRYS